MTLGSLFDGIGGFPWAASLNGIKPVWASEIEAAPISITKRHFPDMKHLGDITKLNGAEIEGVDIITFGSPCQDLSQAGKRAGLEGARSGLFMEAVRIIKEMRNAAAKPRFTVWENVPGAFSSNEGEDFRVVLEEIAKIAEPSVSIPGPPQREGWFISGCVMGDGYSIAWRVFDAQYWGVPQRRRRIFLVADFGSQRAGEILFKPESLSGDITNGRTAGEGAAANAENGSEQYAVDFGRTADRIQMNAKTAVTLQGEGGGGGAKTGLYCLPMFSVHQNQCGEVRVGKVANTLNTNGNATGRNAPLVATMRAHGSGGAGYFAMQGYGDYCLSDVSSTVKERDYKDATDLISDGYVVRRLTPTECERLQGFSDGWTAYGHDGKRIPDSARYRALGNSVAIPCVEFIMRRIKERKQ